MFTETELLNIEGKVKVEFILEQATKAQRGSRGIALLFHDLGTRWGWEVGCQLHAPTAFTPGKDPVPIVQEAGWAPGPVWIGAENLPPHRDSITGSSSP